MLFYVYLIIRAGRCRPELLGKTFRYSDLCSICFYTIQQSCNEFTMSKYSQGFFSNTFIEVLSLRSYHILTNSELASERVRPCMSLWLEMCTIKWYFPAYCNLGQLVSWKYITFYTVSSNHPDHFWRTWNFEFFLRVKPKSKVILFVLHYSIKATKSHELRVAMCLHESRAFKRNFSSVL